MIIKLTGNISFTSNVPFVVSRTEELRNQIEQNWNEFVKSKNVEEYYNGDIFLVTSISNDENSYVFNIGKTKYSDLIFIRQSSELKARSLFVASYIVTSDNYFCIIKDKRGRINTIGGLADVLDFDGDQFVPLNCLRREVMEEIGLDLLCEDIFSEFNAKYVKIPVGMENSISLYPVGVLYELRTKLNRNELLKEFEKNRVYTDGETSELLFYNKENYEQLNQHGHAISYIGELLACLLNVQPNEGFSN